MGRIAQDVDRELLELCIHEAEQNGACRSFRQMCHRVADEYNQLSEQPLLAHTVASRIKRWKINTLTKRREEKKPRRRKRTANAIMIADVLAHMRNKEVLLVLDEVEITFRPRPQVQAKPQTPSIDDRFHL